jgi:GNAT superfamily N-acetyltransferase
MQVMIAETDPEISACFPVMSELRPHITESEFLAAVRRQQHDGYRVAFVRSPAGRIVAVAGYRVTECLAWGRYLYVDDLVTDPSHRSMGYGRELLSWLEARARAEGCAQLHLDSGTHRREAHRFYEREGLAMTCFHYAIALEPHVSSACTSL